MLGCMLIMSATKTEFNYRLCHFFEDVQIYLNHTFSSSRGTREC